VEDLNATLANLRDITKKIQEGKGSIGRLINDETTVTRMDDALAGINNYLTKADTWLTFVDYRGEYLFQESGFRNTLNLRLQPKPDKFYLLGIVSDPVGKRNERVNTTTNTVGGVTTTTTQRVVTYDQDSVKFNAQFAKRFSDITFRAGLFSSTGGLGVDYNLWDDRLRLTLEAYDFRTDYKPHLRAAVDYTFFKYFYLTAGYDDFVSDQDHASFFAGAGISFHDDDLKFLLTNAPKP
jgi:phospholipid/cholesterol/gamma-HCH transport system substrate-binding protein